MTRILVVDDDPNILTTMTITLKREGHEVDRAETFLEAKQLIKKTFFDIVITDLRLGGKGGIDVLKLCKEVSPDSHVVVITAFGSMESAIEAMREGASDYITKPCGPDQIVLSLNRVLEKKRLLSQIRNLRKEVKACSPVDEIIGKSLPMQKLLKKILLVADTDSTVLITGETGTGKDLVARVIHSKSSRNDIPFVAISCAALPQHLLESELFGHVKGAFSGAITNKKGLILEADGGTLFLDEIGEMPASLQSKLLRFIEQGEIRPVGSNKNMYVNVRLIVSTNKDLAKAVKNKEFRKDLYYRLKVVNIHLPPLRHRGNDVLLLANKLLSHFSQKMNKPNIELSNEAEILLKNYDWPGNVRELKHVIEGAVILSNEPLILPKHLDIPSITQSGKTESASNAMALSEVTRRHLLEVLERCHWNQKKATEILEISKATLWRKLKAYNVDVKSLRRSYYS